jgi:hypothetical protein
MEVCVQLKICENCGCLWFRSTQQSVYCSECEMKLRAFPAPETRKRPGRKSRKPVMKICAVAESIGDLDYESWVGSRGEPLLATGGAE